MPLATAGVAVVGTFVGGVIVNNGAADVQRAEALEQRLAADRAARSVAYFDFLTASLLLGALPAIFFGPRDDANEQLIRDK